MKEFTVKTNWLLSELQAALGDEAIAKLTEFHRAKVAEREAKAVQKRAASKITVDTIKEHLGVDAAALLVKKMADQAAAAVSTTLVGASSHESPAAAKSSRRSTTK